MVLGALGCMNNAEVEKKKLVNDNIVLDVFIICQKLRTHTHTHTHSLSGYLYE